MNDTFFMQLALNEAWKYQGLTYPNPAVGCVVTGPHSEILAVAAHKRAGAPHAEVEALKLAYARLSGDSAILGIDDAAELHTYLKAHHGGCFAGCSVFVTLEPCSHEGRTPACADLLAALKPRRVIIAHPDELGDGPGGTAMLIGAGIETQTGLCREEAAALLLPFLKSRSGGFVCFKWAQRLDGSVEGGTVSCDASRRLVHAMRDVCDLLVIGGNTVRTDRPTLDARMVGGKAPDVLIYSRGEHFDRTIPLFEVPGRSVYVEDSLDRLASYRNILIEGGPGMFAASEGAIDYALAFVAPKSGGTIPFTKEARTFDYIHTRQVDEDLLIWLKGR